MYLGENIIKSWFGKWTSQIWVMPYRTHSDRRIYAHPPPSQPDVLDNLFIHVCTDHAWVMTQVWRDNLVTCPKLFLGVAITYVMRPSVCDRYA